MGIYDIIILIAAVVVGVAVALYFLNRWASRKTVEHNDAVERARQPAEIFVIDKKMGKLTEANLPKSAVEQMTKLQKLMKTPLVKAKIGPQIITLLCDKRVFQALPVKKSVKVELAGIYIVDMKGLKSESDYKAQKKEKAKQPDDTKSKKGKKS
jgi:hypothetical protein